MIKTNTHFIVALLTLFSAFVANAQKGQSVTPSYVNIYLSDEIYSLVKANATVDNLIENATDATVDINPENDPVRYLAYNTRLEILALTQKTFKEKLDIDIKPVSSLAGKIEFSGNYPNERKFKKVLQTAGGEDFYLSLDIDMFKGGVGAGVGGVSVGGKLKPVTTINMTIVDTKGKEIQAFEIKEKTDIVVGETKSSIGSVELGDGEDPNIVKEKLMQVYTDALNVLITDYLKDNKKDYK